MADLTPDQLVTLAADITANSGVGGDFEQYVGDLSREANQAIADTYNTIANPAFVVWRTDITNDEINSSVDWSEVVGLTTNKLLSFTLLKNQSIINAAIPSVRGAFTEIFPVNQQPVTNAALVALAKRNATRGEKLFSAGTGTTVAPATMGFEGEISQADVSIARRL